MKMKIKVKVLALAMSSVLLPIAFMLVFTLIQKSNVDKKMSAELDGLARTNLSSIAHGLYEMCLSTNDLLQQKVDHDLNVAREMLDLYGSVDTRSELVTWEAVNQSTKNSVTVQLPKMTVGGVWLGQNKKLEVNTPVVDEVKNLVGGTCTIFQRMNDQGDMLRVATNVQDLNNNRAIGTYIPATNTDGSPNQVVATVLRGERYKGRAYVVNAQYITAYEPIKNTEGKIIGMLYTGVRIESVETLRKAIMATAVGKTGYVYVLNAKGADRGKYVISYKGERDGENIWEAKDSNGNLFIQNIVNKALALKGDEVEFEKYPWKNQGDLKARVKIAGISYFEPWDWVIGVGSYEEDFYDARNKVRADLAGLVSGLLISGLIILAIGAAVAFLMARTITRPINLTVDMIKDIAEGEGDLTKRLQIDSSDEIGELAGWFNTFVEKLQNIILALRANTEEVASAANQISSTSAEMAAGAEEQTSQAAEVASSVQQMTAAILENSQNATETSKIAGQATEKAKEGAEAMNATEKGMDDIVVSATRTGEIVGSLSSRAKQIGEIIQVIDDIADQTNLLALNAAIEAARAGEQGRGFAVVADEVRKLAERTTKATKEIADTIKAIQKDTVDASQSMGEAQSVVNKGKDATVKTKEILGEIVSSVTHAMDMIHQIATASEEQSSGAEQISKNVEAISTVTKQSAGGAEQLAAAAEELNKQTESLRNLVTQFKLDDSGTASQQTPVKAVVKTAGKSTKGPGKLLTLKKNANAVKADLVENNG
jgi:methyl-accepting chemotaxis protein